MNLRIGQEFQINEQLTIQITELDATYVYFAEYVNNKFKTNRNMKRESFVLR